jgi:hypothetical protein
MVPLTTGIMFLLFTCMHFWVWGVIRRWSACVPTAYEVAVCLRRCLIAYMADTAAVKHEMIKTDIIVCCQFITFFLYNPSF